MATLTLPIRELEQSVRNEAEKAQAETECVAMHSSAPRADFGTVCKVAARTLALKWLLSSLVRTQEKLISAYVKQDFTQCSDDTLRETAASLDRIVEKERAILNRANMLGAEIRVWWNASLVKLAEQVEHLDSIAESLHLECDDEASSLLAIAAEQFAMR